MRHGHSAAGWTAVLFASALSASNAIAAAADADELIREGVTLRRGGEDAAALLRFQQAFQIKETPRALAQIGLAEQALGRWASAYEHLHGALDAASDPWIKKNGGLIVEALNHVNEHVGQVEILGGSPDAEVRIDGLGRGKLPLTHPITVPTGTVTIELVAPGFLSAQRITVVRARETIRESFDRLLPLPAQEKLSKPGDVRTQTASAAAGPPGNATTGGPTNSTAPLPPPGTTAEQASTAEPERMSRDQGGSRAGSFRSNAKWIVWGVGAVALGVGIFGAVRQNQVGDDFSNGCGVDPQHNVVTTGSNKTLDACRTLKGSLDSNYRIEIGGLVATGVLAAAGLLLWLTEPVATRTETTALSCSPGITTGHGPSLACSLTF